jgi:hypothetical protein
MVHNVRFSVPEAAPQHANRRSQRSALRLSLTARIALCPSLCADFSSPLFYRLPSTLSVHPTAFADAALSQSTMVGPAREGARQG